MIVYASALLPNSRLHLLPSRFDSGHESASGFSFNADLGVLFQGKVRGKVKSISGTLSNNATAVENVKEDVVKAANKKKLLQYYPVIAVGVSYKF